LPVLVSSRTSGLLVQTRGVYVLALAVGFVPEEQRGRAVARLVELVHQAGDHLDTGFLSVPYLLDALWDSGERKLARDVLWQDSSPSWLYAVDRGATTIWEQWDAIKPNGDIGLASFNHYAFGCVDDWLFRRLAGIRTAAPGFRASVIEPDPQAPLDWVEAHHDTPYGRLAVRWERDPTQAGRVDIHVTVPPNTTSALVLPPTAELVRCEPQVDMAKLGSDPLTISCELT
jgi:alpha-L-rhamnosidase